jgi:adenylate kinase
VVLAQRLAIPAISPGELFRNIMCNDTPLAARLRDVVAYGGYVDDATTNAAVDKRLKEPDCHDGFLIYGYPRTLSQLQHLDDLLGEQQAQLDAVICFKVPDDELVERLVVRERQLGRIDDHADTIRVRLALFHEQTETLIDLYAARGLVVSIDATGTFAQVAQRIDVALSQLHPRTSVRISSQPLG